MGFHPSFLLGRSSLLHVSPYWRATICFLIPVPERQALLLYSGKQHRCVSLCKSWSDAPVGLSLLSEWHKKWERRRNLSSPEERASDDLALLFLLKDSHFVFSFLVLSSSCSVRHGSQIPIKSVALPIHLIILYFHISK